MGIFPKVRGDNSKNIWDHHLVTGFVEKIVEVVKFKVSKQLQ